MARQLPAGMRNFNPGNIKYVGQQGTRPSINTDQGDPQAVYPSAEAGMGAMYQLLAKKYRGGKITANDIIAARGGWTPGNFQAASNVARTAGIRPDEDIGFNDPGRARKFIRGLLLQEHGEASSAYSDAMINAAITGTPVPAVDKPPDTAFKLPENPRRDTPSTAHPVGSTLPGPANAYVAGQSGYGGPGEGASHFGGGVAGGTAGLGTPAPAAAPAAPKSKWGALAAFRDMPDMPVANAVEMSLAQPRAAVVRGEPHPMVDPQMVMGQRQALAQLLAALNQNRGGGMGGQGGMGMG